MLHDVSRRLKALADQNRLAIFEYLRQNESACQCLEEGCCVGEVAQHFDLALSTVSHHLKVLKDAGLIICEKQGQHTYCTVNQQAVRELHAFFSQAD